MAAPGKPDPMPVSEIIVGELYELVGTSICAVAVPFAVGVKTTTMVQAASGASEIPPSGQVDELEIEKLLGLAPANEIELRSAARFPPEVTVMV